MGLASGQRSCPKTGPARGPGRFSAQQSAVLPEQVPPQAGQDAVGPTRPLSFLCGSRLRVSAEAWDPLLRAPEAKSSHGQGLAEFSGSRQCGLASTRGSCRVFAGGGRRQGCLQGPAGPQSLSSAVLPSAGPARAAVKPQGCRSWAMATSRPSSSRPCLPLRLRLRLSRCPLPAFCLPCISPALPSHAPAPPSWPSPLVSCGVKGGVRAREGQAAPSIPGPSVLSQA